MTWGEVAGYVFVLAFAGLAMWGLSKLPPRLRRAGQTRLIRSQSREARRR